MEGGDVGPDCKKYMDLPLKALEDADRWIITPKTYGHTKRTVRMYVSTTSTRTIPLPQGSSPNLSFWFNIAMFVLMILILLVGFLWRVIIMERFRLLKWPVLIQLVFAFGSLALGGLDLARKIVLAYRSWSNATDFLAAYELQNVSLDSIVDSVTT